MLSQLRGLSEGSEGDGDEIKSRTQMTAIFYPEIPAGAQRYEINKSYEWNYVNAPPLPDSYVVCPSEQRWQLCGVEVNSPIAIAAGPLLNGRWILHYAALGYDVLTYKTVRSRAWPCYAQPNLQPIERVELRGPALAPLRAVGTMQGSWAVSFGMPSKSPDLWRFDVEETRRLLPKQKCLAVSVVATPEPGWTIDDLASDYAQCARWAFDSGADFVELNFSCPNVATCDGQLYQIPEQAEAVAQCVRERIGKLPLLIKIGFVPEIAAAEELVNALSGVADGLVMINCISATVRGHDQFLFDGQPRGIAGSAIGAAVIRQLQLFRDVIAKSSSPLEIVAVGGLQSAAHVSACLELGAAGVQLATHIMTS